MHGGNTVTEATMPLEIVLHEPNKYRIMWVWGTLTNSFSKRFGRCCRGRSRSGSGSLGGSGASPAASGLCVAVRASDNPDRSPSGKLTINQLENVTQES